MKANVHYSNVKPVSKQTTNIDLLFWFAYGSFCLMILGMAFGMDLLKLWLK
jgi:hypothetical protein